MMWKMGPSCSSIICHTFQGTPWHYDSDGWHPWPWQEAIQNKTKQVLPLKFLAPKTFAPNKFCFQILFAPMVTKKSNSFFLAIQCLIEKKAIYQHKRPVNFMFCLVLQGFQFYMYIKWLRGWERNLRIFWKNGAPNVRTKGCANKNLNFSNIIYVLYYNCAVYFTYEKLFCSWKGTGHMNKQWCMIFEKLRFLFAHPLLPSKDYISQFPSVFNK